MTGDNPITEEQIKVFAAAWYQALDQHVPAEELPSWWPTTWR